MSTRQDKRVTAEEILAEIDIDVKQIAQKVADAINNAQAGAIINQSEEQVRCPCRVSTNNVSKSPEPAGKKPAGFFPLGRDIPK